MNVSYKKQNCFVFSKKDLLEMMQNAVDDSSLEYDTRPHLAHSLCIYSPAADVGYDPTMIMERVSIEVGQEINHYCMNYRDDTVFFM